MKRAFTLIELMVTISIIGILLSSAIPVYENYILKARFDEAVAGTKAISLAMENYKVETGKYYPYDYIGDGTYMSDGKQLYIKLKVNLKNSKNFLYAIKTNNSGTTYTIKAILRKSGVWDSSRCADSDTSDRRCVQTNSLGDTWLNKYSRGINNHYIQYDFPPAANTIDGIDYTNIYKE